MGGDQVVAGGSLLVDLLHTGTDRAVRRAAGGSQVGAGWHPEIDGPSTRLLRQSEQIGCLLVEHRVPHGTGNSVLQPDLTADGVHQVIDPRHPLVIGTGEPG